MNDPTVFLQRAAHRVLQWRFRIAIKRRGSLRKCARSPLRIFKEMLEVAHAFSLGAREINLVWFQRRENDQLGSRAGDCNVKPSRPAILIERPEVLRHTPA